MNEKSMWQAEKREIMLNILELINLLADQTRISRFKVYAV